MLDYFFSFYMVLLKKICACMTTATQAHITIPPVALAIYRECVNYSIDLYGDYEGIGLLVLDIEEATVSFS